MKAAHKTTQVLEPVGIVISSGWEPEQPPVFSAYEWGPAPKDGAGKGKPVAA
ncbi:MAG TPA: hypothetical protein VMV51_08645 [Gemmatimonadaceae bacterium]|nr:hypothetical protein [Gemmatimonadaceae bacterium]